ncbi:hypothetical protein J7E81_08850 [Bacillus sp. ISL-18]|uniref:hypothetical protein n=1 Tax=Bacillus sp. ISL-18 TaxID=2819118 RepID=UPI001BE63DB3|nr:hypothetical protein [Bacillus sp. ISL-18]
MAFEEEGEIIWNRSLMLTVQQANEIRISEDKFGQALLFSSHLNIQEYLEKLWDFGFPINSPLPNQGRHLVSLHDYLTPFRTANVGKEKRKHFSWDDIQVPLTIVQHAILGQFSQGKKAFQKTIKL